MDRKIVDGAIILMAVFVIINAFSLVIIGQQMSLLITLESEQRDALWCIQDRGDDGCIQTIHFEDGTSAQMTMREYTAWKYSGQ